MSDDPSFGTETAEFEVAVDLCYRRGWTIHGDLQLPLKTFQAHVKVSRDPWFGDRLFLAGGSPVH